jgi:hypothetical protein
MEHLINEELKKECRRLAQAFVDGMKVTNGLEIRATLNVDGQLFATGIAEVGASDARFSPERPNRLETFLRGEVVLKDLGSEKSWRLKQSQAFFGVGDAQFWFFEIET